MSRNGISGTITLVFMALVFLAVGLGVVFCLGLPAIKMAKASSDWPATSGIIKNSSVEQEVNTSGSGRDKKSKTMYRAQVCFKYNVQGSTLFSSRIKPGVKTSSSNSASAYATVNKYPEGSSVQVYYDPENPSTAVLEPGLTGSTYFPLVFGCVFALIGFLIGAIPGFKMLVAMFAIGSTMAGSSSGEQFSGHAKDLQPSSPANEANSWDNSEQPAREYQSVSSSDSDGFTIR